MGVWIETRPSYHKERQYPVTPCMGVWIETSTQNRTFRPSPVTPCMGVWIETAQSLNLGFEEESHPVWVCGLKLAVSHQVLVEFRVTPCMGVWIETDKR